MKTVAILIFDEVEVLDFCGPFEVFSVASHRVEPPAFEVLLVAEQDRLISARNGLRVQPHHTLDNCPSPDIVLVPGGIGARTEMHNTRVLDWVKKVAAKAELVLSVCTGALILGKAGLLDGQGATTHHSAIDSLREAAPTASIHADRRFVDNGKIVCSAGIAAGIDMSLHIVRRLLGKEVAVKTATYMEYPLDS